MSNTIDNSQFHPLLNGYNDTSCCSRSKHGQSPAHGPPGAFDKELAQVLEQFMTQLFSMFSNLLTNNGAASQTGAMPTTRAAAPTASSTPSSPSSASSAVMAGASRAKPSKAKLNGFLWKPTSDSNGKLVILLPPEISQQQSSVSVVGPDGKVLAKGKMGGIGNGNRRHFRFDRSGSSFPPGSVVVIKLANGTTKKVVIENPSQRNELRHIK